MRTQLRNIFFFWLAMVFAATGAFAEKETWDSLAKKYGCEKKVVDEHAKDDSFYMAQYIPKGQTKTNWARSFTVQLFRAPADTKASDKYIEGLIKQIPKTIEGGKPPGDVMEWDADEGKDGPTVYGEFLVAGEHTVMTIYRVARGVVAVNQFAVRKAKLSDAEKLYLKQTVAR